MRHCAWRGVEDVARCQSAAVAAAATCRLQRNRESARHSRQRKKQYLEALETKVVQLHTQIAALRAHHCAALEGDLAEQRRHLLHSLEAVLAKPSRSAEDAAIIVDGVAQLVDRYGPDSSERRAVREYHFDQLQRLLLPPHIKFLLWVIHQPPEFFAPAAAAGAGSGASVHSDADAHAGAGGTSRRTLWELLCSEIGLAGEQAERVKAQLRKMVGGPDVPRETWRLGVAFAFLVRLRIAVTARAAAMQEHLEALVAILTPEQMARYFVWMEANGERVQAAVDAATTAATTGALGAAAAATYGGGEMS